MQSAAIQMLLRRANPDLDISATILLNMDRYDRLPQPVSLTLEETSVIAVANSLARRLQAPIRLRVDVPSVVVTDHATGSQGEVVVV